MSISDSEEGSADCEGELIPGLPSEIAELCLLRLPFPYRSLARSVSKPWNRSITSPQFVAARNSLALSLPYLFVFAFHRSTSRAVWLAFDPRSRSWFPLPPMPCSLPPCLPSSVACAALSHQGSLFVMGGLRSDAECPTPLPSVVAYAAATNSWTTVSPMRTPRSFFAAASIGGRIFAAGVTGPFDQAVGSTEYYDPASNRWAPAASMRAGTMAGHYNATAVGLRLYITEGWSWPFTFAPRGQVYDAEVDAWQEMPVGMCEGWTGAGFALHGRLFVVREYGDCKLKVYEDEDDTWQDVIGFGLPPVVKKPFVVQGVEGRVYVVGSGLSVGIGKIFLDKRTGWKVEWEDVVGPPEFEDLAPSHCEVLYA